MKQLSYWSYIYMFYISFIIHIVLTSKQWYQGNHCRYSRKWQHEIIVCVVCCINIVIRLRRYIVSINFFYIINCLYGQNFYMFCCYNSKEDKSVFALKQNLFRRFAVYRIALIQYRGSSLVVTHCMEGVRLTSDRPVTT